MSGSEGKPHSGTPGGQAPHPQVAGPSTAGPQRRSTRGQTRMVEAIKRVAVRHIELKPFQWIHPQGAFASRCDLDVYLLKDYALVVATEREQDPGSGLSVSSGAVTLATIIMQKFGLRPENLTWIEHYPLKALGSGTPYHLGEYYNRVRFRFEGSLLTDPRWEPMDKDGVEALIEAFARQQD